EDGIRDWSVTGVQTCALPIFNPLSTTPGKQPLPLSLMSLAAMLEERGDEWVLVDGNVCADPAAAIIARLSKVRTPRTVLLGVTRSEERRVGKECRSRWAAERL